MCNRMVTSVGPKDTARQEKIEGGGLISSWEMRLLVIALLAGERPARAAALDRESGERVVREAAVAGGRNYIPGDRDQPAGDVAAGDVRPGLDRNRTDVGRRARHEHDARVPARPAVEAGLVGIPATHREVPFDRGQPRDQADLRAVRFVLGPVPAGRAAARAQARRAQFGLGAESGREFAEGSRTDTTGCGSTCRA